jgi:pimeloyl-ACP methyl ester carboxylesterase
VNYKQRLLIKYIQAKFKVLAVISKRKAAEKAFKLFCTPLSKAITKKIPKNACAVSFNLKNKTIRGYCWNANASKTLLILHGFGSAAYKFERYVNPAVQKGYRVLAFDAPAHGKSDGKQTHALEYSQAIIAIVKQFGTVDSFIAHSFGGIALGLALEQLPHNHQTKVVFIAPATETQTVIDSTFKLLKINDKEVRTEFDNLIVEISGQQPAWFSLQRIVKTITPQILWIHDEDDDTTPLKDALVVQAHNHSHIQFVITKGLGHRRIYHDATVKKHVVNFL